MLNYVKPIHAFDIGNPSDLFGLLLVDMSLTVLGSLVCYGPPETGLRVSSKLRDDHTFHCQVYHSHSDYPVVELNSTTSFFSLIRVGEFDTVLLMNAGMKLDRKGPRVVRISRYIYRFG